MNRIGVREGIKEIFDHPWFGNLNLKKIYEKKIQPPLKPDLLQFNLNEKDFYKDEEQTVNKLK